MRPVLYLSSKEAKRNYEAGDAMRKSSYTRLFDDLLKLFRPKRDREKIKYQESPLEDIRLYTLYEAVHAGHVRVLWAIGDNTTTHLRLTIRNLRDYSITIVIEEGTTFKPKDKTYQEMIAIRNSNQIHLKPLETRSIWVNTACLQMGLIAPTSPLALVRTHLQEQGLNDSNIERVIEDDYDEVKLHIKDLENIGMELGYTPDRIHEITKFLMTIKNGQRKIPNSMGYSLASFPAEYSVLLRCLLASIGKLDNDIARVSYQAEEPVEEMIRAYGRKRLLIELQNEQESFESFKEEQYFIHFDSALAENIFVDSGYSFKPFEAIQLVDYDQYDDPDWHSAPRLNSLVIQFAFWAITDGSNLDDCCRIMPGIKDDANLLSAGVRALLLRAAKISLEFALDPNIFVKYSRMFSASKTERDQAKINIRLLRNSKNPP